MTSSMSTAVKVVSATAACKVSPATKMQASKVSGKKKQELEVDSLIDNLKQRFEYGEQSEDSS